VLDSEQDLFEHELRDVYDAEKKLVRALENMANKVTDERLSSSISEHRTTTQQQVKRLEQVFKLLDKKPRREPCRGINGLINEFTKFVKEEPSDEILNIFAVGAGLKVEQYEIVAYQSLLRLAQQLGMPDARDLLTQNLMEEEATAVQLEALADQLGGSLTPVGDEPIVMPAAMDEEVVVLAEEETSGRLAEPPL
jgi:ferritin-like metal-binding protein YciE